MTTDTSSAVEPQQQDIELAVTGMTCASCANRIQRKLNKLDGVSASVNYATEKAKVSFPVGGDITPHLLVETVEQAGYGATLPTPPAETATTDGPGHPGHGDPDADTGSPEDAHLAAMRQRLIISTVLSVPVLLGVAVLLR